MGRTTLSARFGGRVRAARLARGFSQAELAAAVGLSSNHLGVVERGEKVPTLETVEALAKALKLAVADLVADEVPSADPWIDELKVAAAAVPPTHRALALAVLRAFGKHRERRARGSAR
jgi:transcriptional regulator with XRE-family HTH domain